MSKDITLTASVNPLIFIDADDRFHFGQERHLTAESILRYICSDTFIPEMENIKKSYAWIAKNAIRLFIVPAEYKILEKMIRPLKNAIGSYMLGNALETIALCGTVTEMITIFLFEISELTLDGKPVSNEEEIKLNFERFEKLGQADRVKKLMELGLIDEETKVKIDLVRKRRNEYLHKLSKTNENIAPDAKEIFDATLDIFLKITQLEVKDGKAIINQKILDYLNKKGLIQRSS